MDDRNDMERRKKKKKKCDKGLTEDSVSFETIDKTGKCKKRKHDSGDVVIKTEGHENNMKVDSEIDYSAKFMKKKKKRKRHDMAEAEEISKKDSSSKRMKLNNEPVSDQISENQEVKKKKKLKKKSLHHEHKIESVSPDQASLTASPSEVVNKKRKKKKKEREGSENGVTDNKSPPESDTLNSATSDDKRLKKKKKKSHTHDIDNGNVLLINQEICPDTISSKKKKKEKVKETESKLDCSSSHKRNGSDKNQTLKRNARFQSDHEVVVKSSVANVEQTSFTESDNNAECEDFAANKNVKSSNQWVTASLGCENRNQKFMRLLGGFRKGTGNLGLKSGQKGGSLAMNREQENIYKKDMENEYEKAMTMNFQRGIGLGFEPPPDAGKKFYIDKAKSKSKKFQDSD